MIQYVLPDCWIKYDPVNIAQSLAEAKAALLSLRSTPYQWDWIESLNKMELKREVAGTSRIEGADFTEKELDLALEANQETAEQLITRSQKQVHAAVNTYRWIAKLPPDLPLDDKLICEIHARIIKNADEDHCPAGTLRSIDQNVHFGQPPHRGTVGGNECAQAFQSYTRAIQTEFKNHDPIVQALAAHYHFAAIHPFLDGNGRTARAIEALFLQRAGLKDICFIAMSNYYYDEKATYLQTLADVRADNHNLTPFLQFGLKGIASQSHRLLKEINRELQKAVFRNLMFNLFNRLKTERKRVIVERQINLLQLLLEVETLSIVDLYKRQFSDYKGLVKPMDAFFRDLSGLDALGTVKIQEVKQSEYHVSINLDWPANITQTTFFETAKNLPKAKTYPFFR